MSSADPNGSLIWDCWQHWADDRPDADAIIHWVPDREAYRWTFGRLHAAAMAIAWHLKAHGVGRGDVCALIMRHHEGLYPIYLGVSYLGAIPSVLAYPNPRLHPDKFRDGITGMAQKSGLDWILTEKSLESCLEPVVRHGRSTIRRLLFPLEWETTDTLNREHHQAIVDERANIGPESPLLLQHSSGTTGLQKAVVLSHDAILGHLSRYAHAIQLTDTDKIASWLPLYHDMGLIAAFHLPLAFGLASVQIDPFCWVNSPLTLLEAVARERCTLAWMPNFAFNLMADSIHEEDLADIRLDSLRMIISCSEPIRADSLEKFHARFAAYGLRKAAIGTCYAMAEATFAVTQSVPGVAVNIICVDRDRLSEGRVDLVVGESSVGSRRCVSSGRPILDCDVRIVGSDGIALADGCVGEVAIRTASMFSGYRDGRATIMDVPGGDWYRTGDLGLAHQGEYYIVGRIKDIIIIAGTNIYPEDVEDAVSAIPGVIPGRVVAFGVDNQRSGTEQVEVAAETSLESTAEREGLQREIVVAGMLLNLTIARVHLLPPRTLIKSSSGKPSRRANKERILAALSAG